MLDVILLPAVQINCLFVNKDQRTRKIDFTYDIWLASDFNDHEIVAGDGAQADGIGGISFVRAVIVFSGEVQKSGFRKPCAKIGKVYVAEFFVGLDRQFKCRAFQMVDKNFQVVRLDECMLRGAAKEIIGMSHHELVERRGGSYEHGAGASAAAPRAASALPGGGNRPGVARHNHGVE